MKDRREAVNHPAHYGGAENIYEAYQSNRSMGTRLLSWERREIHLSRRQEAQRFNA